MAATIYSRRLRLAMLLSALILLVVSLLLLSNAAMPAVIERVQSTLAPTLLTPPVVP